MSSDKINIVTRERPMSSDINNLQLMQTRMLEELMRGLTAARRQNQTGGQEDPRSASTGMSAFITGNVVTLRPGLLAQYNATHPAAPGPLEIAERLGWLHTDTNINFPNVVSVSFLMELRVVDVVTSAESRDVMDLGGNFVPTSVDKQIERRVEAQFIQGTTTAYPAFSGGTWVPWCIFCTDGAGVLDVTKPVVDLRPDVQDMLGQWQSDILGVPSWPNAQVLNNKLVTEGFGGSLTLLGNVDGNLLGSRFWFRGSRVPAVDTGVAGTNDVEHVYLCPLIANGVIAVPRFLEGLSDSAGVLTRSQVAPYIHGRHNNGTITLPQPWGNFTALTASRALHVGSFFRSGVGWCYGAQDAKGRYRGGDGTIAARKVTLASLVAIPTATVEIWDIDMSALLPPNAETALVHIAGIFTGTGGDRLCNVHLYPNGGSAPTASAGESPADYMHWVQTAPDSSDDTLGHSFGFDAELPVSSSGGVSKKIWKLAVGNNSGANINAIIVEFTLLGWSY